MSNWRRNLRRLGTLAAADEVDRALQRTCIGRIVSMLTLIFIVLCVLIYGGALLALDATGLRERLPASGGVLTAGACVGLFLAIILAGLIGNWLRRLFWQALLRRRRDRYGL